jgi:sensor histidine kinase regulating citrate/malate metabolism
VVVTNLLSNALKFTFTGGIAVRLTGAGDEVRLEVADTGVGVPRTSCPACSTASPASSAPGPAATRARASASRSCAS